MTETHFEGQNCKVVLDTDQRTVTMYHSGMLTLGAKKKASPRVIPFDAIESVEYKTGFTGGSLRIIRHDRDGYKKTANNDFNAFIEDYKNPAAEFANQIREAVGLPTEQLTSTEPAAAAPAGATHAAATAARSAGRGVLAEGEVARGDRVRIYNDGTFEVGLSGPDRLLGFSHETDSMRRKSLTGRGAAAIVTGGYSLAASNNRGVMYVSITGETTGVKTYTTRNPTNTLLQSIRSLQAAADAVLRNGAAPAASTPAPSAPVPAAPAPAAAAPAPADIATQLTTLSQLHASGALTDEEFEAAKGRILSQ